MPIREATYTILAMYLLDFVILGGVNHPRTDTLIITAKGQNAITAALNASPEMAQSFEMDKELYGAFIASLNVLEFIVLAKPSQNRSESED